MFCDRCGTELQAGQRFCGSCGKPAGMTVVPAADGRVGRHITILAALWLAASALNLIGAAALFMVGNVIVGHIIVRMQGGWPWQGFVQGLLSTLALLVFVKALAGFAAGWGLLERQPWARPLTLVLGFISLLNIPLGTALGIYTIWVMVSRQAEEEYRQLSRAA